LVWESTLGFGQFTELAVNRLNGICCVNDDPVGINPATK